MPNLTHRKRIARAYATFSGQSYTRALTAVEAAAAAGALPETLDADGLAAAVAILDERAKQGLGTEPRTTPSPRNIRSQHIVPTYPGHIEPGDVTIYGVVIGKRPERGGFFLDFAHSNVIFAEADEPMPVLCRVDETFVDALIDAYEAEQARYRR